MDELYHHGVKGQRWGILRYQNKDGSLTPLGKSRRKSQYVNKSKKPSSEERAKLSNSKKRRELSDMVKNRKLMSDKTLKEKIERLKLEKQFKDLVEDDIAPGRKAIKEILAEAGKKGAATALTGAMLYTGKAALSKEFNPKELGDAIFNGGPKKK